MSAEVLLELAALTVLYRAAGLLQIEAVRRDDGGLWRVGAEARRAIGGRLIDLAGNEARRMLHRGA